MAPPRRINVVTERASKPPGKTIQLQRILPMGEWVIRRSSKVGNSVYFYPTDLSRGSLDEDLGRQAGPEHSLTKSPRLIDPRIPFRTSSDALLRRLERSG